MESLFAAIFPIQAGSFPISGVQCPPGSGENPAFVLMPGNWQQRIVLKEIVSIHILIAESIK
jgi:hypothetical protein